MTDRDTGDGSTAGAVPLVAGHTPGPWRLHANFLDRVVAGGVGSAHTFVADCRYLGTSGSYREHFVPPHEITLANARLIAAAPKMLAALLRVRDLSAAKDDLTPMCSDIYDQMDAIFGVAQNILREMGHAADTTKARASSRATPTT